MSSKSGPSAAVTRIVMVFSRIGGEVSANLYENLGIPEGSVVILIGVPGSGKSTWARQWFPESNILSSDKFREMLTDDENNQECSYEAFQLLGKVSMYRIKNGLTTVIDATNTKQADRAPYVADAYRYTRPCVAVFFNVDFEEAVRRDSERARTVGRDVIDKFWNRITPEAINAWNLEFDMLFSVSNKGSATRLK